MELWIVDPGVPGVVNLKLKRIFKKDNTKTKRLLYFKTHKSQKTALRCPIDRGQKVRNTKMFFDVQKYFPKKVITMNGSAGKQRKTNKQVMGVYMLIS